MGQAGGIQAGGRRQLGAIFAEPEPGLPAHLHVAGREDALASGAGDTALVPVLIHLADQADALPFRKESSTSRSPLKLYWATASPYSSTW